MIVDEELEQNLRQINSSLRNIASFYAATTGDRPLWYGRMLSNVLLLTGSEAIHYVTGHVDHEMKSAEVILFTQALAIVTKINDLDSEADDHIAWAIPRHGLRRLGVSTGQGVFSNSAFSDWPNKIRLQASYDGVEQPLTVPLEQEMNGDRVKQLRELLQSLQLDLAQIGERQ